MITNRKDGLVFEKNFYTVEIEKTIQLGISGFSFEIDNNMSLL